YCGAPIASWSNGSRSIATDSARDDAARAAKDASRATRYGHPVHGTQWQRVQERSVQLPHSVVREKGGAVPLVKEIVLATRNANKGAELVALLSDLGIRIRTLAEFPGAPEVEEDGQTCEANAVKKAQAIMQYTGLTTAADDTGLEVEALGGRPGVH